MSTDPTIGNITVFAGNFAPVSWMFCQGQLISIAQYTALYSIIGTTYGGDGIENFALPDFRSRVAVGTGQAPGMAMYQLGELGGQEAIVLSINNLPAHTHPLPVTPIVGNPYVAPIPGNLSAPEADVPAITTNINSYNTEGTGSMAVTTVTTNTVANGGYAAMPVLSPVLAMNFVIAVEGIYPSRP